MLQLQQGSEAVVELVELPSPSDPVQFGGDMPALVPILMCRAASN